jgi:uncharacterized sporulation protein YeaH/YhbH (DUF444 family)
MCELIFRDNEKEDVYPALKEFFGKREIAV